MKVPLQITFRDVDPSEAVEARVREKLAKLETHCDRITGCKVTISAPHRHHQQGKMYQVRIELTLPSADIIVGDNHSQDHAHEDVYVALRDSFKAAERQVSEHMERVRGEVKNHGAAEQTL